MTKLALNHNSFLTTTRNFILGSLKGEIKLIGLQKANTATLEIILLDISLICHSD